MVRTDVINATEVELFLKEGNAGVYRDIKKLKKGDNHPIEIDPNATYREYVVVSTSSGAKVFVTSDDCIDNSTITIVDNPDGGYKFEGKLRSDSSTATPAEEAVSGGFFSRLMKKIGLRK